MSQSLIEILIKAIDKASEPMDKVTKSANKMGTSFTTASKSLSDLAAKTPSLTDDIGKFEAMLSSATPQNLKFASTFGTIKDSFEAGTISGQEAQAQISALKKEMEDAEGQTKKLAEEQKEFADGLNAIKNAGFGVFAGFVSGAIAASVALYKLGEAGAQVQRMQEASSGLATSFGSDMDVIVSAVSRASLGTVSDMDIMSAASRAMMLGVSADADQLANLMEVAAFRARAMGISTTQAFNDIVTGIGRQSPLILDNLGIVVNAEENYKAYAESLGKTADQLTEAEKSQALLNSVLIEGNRLIETAGGLTLDAAGQYEKFGAHIQNLKDRLLGYLSDAVTPVITATNEQLDITDLLTEAVDRHVISQQDAIEITSQLRQGKLDYATVEADLTQKMEDQQHMQEFVNSTYDATYVSAGNAATATEDLAGATEAAAAAAERAAAAEKAFMENVQAGIKGSIADAFKSYGEKLGDLKTKHDELQSQLETLQNQGWSPTSEKIKDVTEALDENEQAQEDAQAAIEETITQMLFQQASAGLDAGATLQLAYAMGVLSEDDYTLAVALDNLKTKYDANKDGTIDAKEATAGYTVEVKALNDAMAAAQSKKISLEAELILEGNWGALSYFDASFTGTGTNAGHQKGTGLASGGAFDVPEGYPNDTYGPVWLSSGEHVEVTPAGSSPGGNPQVINIYLDGEQIFTKSIARQLKSQGVPV